MNTKNLKAYAPKARTQFIDAVKKRAAHFGIYEDRIEDVRIEGGAAIIEGRAFTRKEGEQRKRLESKVVERGYDMFIREMAYTWFNRLAALRYMEIHDYFDHGFRVLSHPANSDGLPEILSHASDVADSLDLDKSHIIELQLAGDKEEELYRELLLGQCHHLYKIMPFMFEAIDDATELLLPNNLTKTDSILKGLINDIPEEDWQEIEVIGWLYQFYISEHKDAVIGKVVKSEDIPAATQLFTPNWIVKYLVQNSVGRQWLATYPDSELKGKMEYYIEPAEQSDEVIEQLKAITPTSIDPEEIKVLDPACGSGHILVEVYEVLREIYLERGYRLREIPELILTKNIYGLDIDDRAAQLAGFALMMKAREDDRRIFQRVEDGEVSLNVLSLQSTAHLDIPKLWKALDLEGNQQAGSTGGLFDEASNVISAKTGIYGEYYELLQMLMSAFLQAKTLGSLIQIEHQYLKRLISLKELLAEKSQGTDPTAKQAALQLLPIVDQSVVLSIQYDSVVANPPYMGMKGMNSEVKKYVKSNYSASKNDLFAVYIERNLEFGKLNCQLGMVTPYVWMFISSYEELRNKLINQHTLTSLVQLEYNAFAPACIPVCAFTFSKNHLQNVCSTFIKLSDFKGHENQAPRTLEAITSNTCSWKYITSPDLFNGVPGQPIAYWMTDETVNAFSCGENLGDIASPRKGNSTSDNNRFLRFWAEVDICKLGLNLPEFDSQYRWIPYNKGGGFRKWYGFNEFVIDWKDEGKEIRDIPTAVIANESFFFKPGLTWSTITSSYFSIREFGNGYIFDNGGCCIFGENYPKSFILALLNSKVFPLVLGDINPTLNFQSGDVAKFPVLYPSNNEKIDRISELANLAVSLAKVDWDSYEKSWDYKRDEVIQLALGVENSKLQITVEDIAKNRSDNTTKLFDIENEINTILLEVYNIEETSTPELSQITLSRNGLYNFQESEENIIIERQTSDAVAEICSYFVGCVMGRFSLDREGLVFAHSANEGFKVLEAEGAFRSFPADDDGIIPLASEEWLFDDDATTRFKEFVKTVWGDENLSENLEFVAESLCLHAIKPKKGEGAMDTIRRYFSTQFFKDHCKTYKKRPIYWLFSSGKEKAFECLVYLHRYNEGTLSRMRTEYVTPLMGKYDAQHTLLSEQQLKATGTEARRIEKELKSLEKKQAELRTFDEQLKHYAEMRITLDLDDGVKANYGKFGNLLADVKAIHGKAVK